MSSLKCTDVSVVVLVRLHSVSSFPQPIPIELLAIEDDNGGTLRNHLRKTQALTKKSSFSKDRAVHTVSAIRDAKGQHTIRFRHLGRKAYDLTLWTTSALSQKKWIENITKQQEATRERSLIFDTVTLSEGFFVSNKVNCAAPYSKFVSFLESLIINNLVRWGSMACVWYG